MTPTGPANSPRPPGLGRPPVLLLLPAAVAAFALVLPPLALLLTTSWRGLFAELGDPQVAQAIGLTAATSGLTVLACWILGTPLAWVLARLDFPGRSLLRALVTVPLVLPPVVAGVALVSALGRDGLLGTHLPWQVPYTTAAVVLAHTFVALPFYVLSVEGALRAGGTAFDQVAATLGASRWLTFRRVTVPLALPGLLAGSVLAWARSLGEFGATITFAGNYPGTTQTMPSLIYQVLQGDRELAQGLSLLLLLTCVVVLVLLRGSWVPGR